MTEPVAIDLEHLRGWIGRTETRVECAAPGPIAALAATLDRDDPAPADGTPVPPLWHWTYFVSLARHSEIGPDGHAKRGGFLPPVPLPRRMWAGGRLDFHGPLRVGDTITRTSRILDVTAKSGRSGSLVFVTVRHEYAGADGAVLDEEHDIVYREHPRADAPAPPPQPAPTGESFSREVLADPVLLFRYSALTFNGHRIHYDRSYVTGVEGYPGLIVHGPLIATLLVDLLQRYRPHAELRHFRFRALRPIFDIHPFTLSGREEPDGRVALWARDHDGWHAIDAEAQLA